MNHQERINSFNNWQEIGKQMDEAMESLTTDSKEFNALSDEQITKYLELLVKNLELIDDFSEVSRINKTIEKVDQISINLDEKKDMDIEVKKKLGDQITYLKEMLEHLKEGKE